MWWLSAASAVPAIANMLMPQPSLPQYSSAPSAQNPNETAYQNQMLANAFDPQSQANQIAANQATNQVNDQMSRMGLSRSSMGAKGVMDANAQVQRNWQQDAAKRQSGALDSLNQATQIQNQMNKYNTGLQNQMAQNAYNQAAMQRMNAIYALSGLAGAGANMYGGGGGYTPMLDQSGGAWSNPALMSSLGSYSMGDPSLMMMAAGG